MKKSLDMEEDKDIYIKEEKDDKLFVSSCAIVAEGNGINTRLNLVYTDDAVGKEELHIEDGEIDIKQEENHVDMYNNETFTVQKELHTEEDMEIYIKQESDQFVVFTDETKIIAEQLYGKGFEEITKEENKGISSMNKDNAEDVHQNVICIDINNEGLKHRGVRNFSCRTCQKKFTNKDGLYEHLHAHSEAKPYKCDLCDFRTANHNYLKIHLTSQHGSCEKLSCFICQKMFKTTALLNKHIRTHKEKSYKCNFCGYIAISKRSLQTHTKYTHNDERKYSCNTCKKTFASNDMLNMHLCAHTRDKPHKCDLCDYRAKAKSVIAEHMMCKHSDRRDYVCYVCQKPFATNAILNRHLRTHREKPYKCDLCDFRACYKGTVTDHLESEHNKKQDGICHVCQKNFGSYSRLERHLRVHTGEKPYKCDFCDYRAAAKYTMVKHIERKHSEQNFVCHICGKILKSEVFLNKHLIVHTEAKLYKCELCGYSTEVKSTMIRHLKRRHREIKNFVCHLCQDTFPSKALLNRHLSVHTGEKPYLI